MLFAIHLHLVTEALTGKTEKEAEALFHSFHHTLTDISKPDDADFEKLKFC